MRQSYLTPLVVALESYAYFSSTFAGVLLRWKLSGTSDWFTLQVESLRNHIERRQGNRADDENHDRAQPRRTPDIGNALAFVHVIVKPQVLSHIGSDKFVPEELLMFDAIFQ